MRYLLLSLLLAMGLLAGACTPGGQMANSEFYNMSRLVPNTPYHTVSGTGAMESDAMVMPPTSMPPH